jgi:hypothetical protein
MTLLAGIMKKMIDGKRDPDILSKGMEEKGKKLVMSLLRQSF